MSVNVTPTPQMNIFEARRYTGDGETSPEVLQAWVESKIIYPGITVTVTGDSEGFEFTIYNNENWTAEGAAGDWILMQSSSFFPVIVKHDDFLLMYTVV